MSNFKTDVQLLADLQSLINEADKTANMDTTTSGIVGRVLPGGKGLIPAAQERARHQIDVLTRARDRLSELMEAQHK